MYPKDYLHQILVNSVTDHPLVPCPKEKLQVPNIKKQCLLEYIYMYLCMIFFIHSTRALSGLVDVKELRVHLTMDVPHSSAFASSL